MCTTHLIGLIVDARAIRMSAACLDFIARFVHFGGKNSLSMPNSELQDIFSEQKALSTPKTCLASLGFALESNADSEMCAGHEYSQ